MAGKAMATTENFVATTGRSARAVLLPEFTFLYRCALPTTSTPPAPVFASNGVRSFASSVNPPETKGFKDYKLPPVNPPDKENPDAVTLRAQWDNAVRLYGRTYSHAWGTAIMAGVVLFGVGWWVKGENPLKALDPTGEIKKEETAKIE